MLWFCIASVVLTLSVETPSEKYINNIQHFCLGYLPPHLGAFVNVLGLWPSAVPVSGTSGLRQRVQKFLVLATNQKHALKLAQVKILTEANRVHNSRMNQQTKWSLFSDPLLCLAIALAFPGFLSWHPLLYWMMEVNLGQLDWALACSSSCLTGTEWNNSGLLHIPKCFLLLYYFTREKKYLLKFHKILFFSLDWNYPLLKHDRRWCTKNDYSLK